MTGLIGETLGQTGTWEHFVAPTEAQETWRFVYMVLDAAPAIAVVIALFELLIWHLNKRHPRKPRAANEGDTTAKGGVMDFDWLAKYTLIIGGFGLLGAVSAWAGSRHCQLIGALGAALAGTAMIGAGLAAGMYYQREIRPSGDFKWVAHVAAGIAAVIWLSLFFSIVSHIAETSGCDF